MTNGIHYLIVKEKDKKEITYFEYDKLKGFNMTSKNKNIRLKDAINVNKMIIINPSFIEKLINRKINNKFKKLIDLLSNICSGDEDDPSGVLMHALNEIEKFKRELINKYVEYMNKEQLKLLNKKINILEQEVTMRIYYLNEKREIQEEYETKKAR